MITCSSTGLRYIGQTVGSIEDRFLSHLRGTRQPKRKMSKLQRAMEEYGHLDFKIKLIEDKIEDIDDLATQEKHYIKKYGTINEYNSSKGGESKLRGGLMSKNKTEREKDKDSPYDICYHNNFNNIIVKGLNPSEHNLLLGLLGRMKNLSTDEIIIDLNDLSYLSGLEKPSRQQVVNTAESMWSKVKSTDYSPSAQYGNDSNISGRVLLFSYFSIDKKANILSLRINPYLEYFINNFSNGHYTSLEFKNCLLIRSKYGKILYRLLSQFFSIGICLKKEDELKRLLDCPATYDTKKFNNRVIIPAMKSISELVPNLTLHKIKTRRSISHYEFRFSPQKNKK